VDKLIKVNFICEVRCPTCSANIVPIRKTNHQLWVCVYFRDLNNACPKDDFPLPITKLLMDATIGCGALSFTDVFWWYNQIIMNPIDEDLTTFCAPQGI